MLGSLGIPRGPLGRSRGNVRVPVVSTYSLSVDGANDYVLISSALASLIIGSPITVSFWFKAIATGAIQELVSNYNAGADYAFLCEVGRTPNRLSFVWGGVVVVTGSLAVSPGAWNHAVFVRSGSSGSWVGTLYLNGDVDNSAATAVDPGATANPTYVGSAVFGLPFGGIIDDLRIYNIAKSAEDVAALYAGTDDRAGAVGYWPFEEGSGTTTADLIGGNTGTLTNGPTWSTDVPTPLQ